MIWNNPGVKFMSISYHRLLGILLVSLLLFTGCTIKYSFTGASIPPDAKTVSIADFKNMAPLINATLSNEMTEAMKDRFMSQTSLNLTRSEGDLSFEGTITDYKTQPMAIQAGDVASKNRFTITVKVKFTNRLAPKSNYDATFTRYTDYDSNLNFDDVEKELSTVLIKQLVEDIFNKAVVNW
jgi:hypothetical protein